MGALMRELDWSTTPVGPIDTWPQSLKTAVSLILNSSFPMFIWWGEKELTHFYNDAYMNILGDKHPDALGRSGKVAWAEIWDDVGPLAQGVFHTGEPVFMKDLPLVMYRNGQVEQTHFTFSYSSIRDESGGINGLYCACVETTNEINHLNVLQESEERFRTMAEESDILIGMSGADGNAIYFNKPWEVLTGRPVKEMYRLGWADLIHEDDKENFLSLFMDALKKQKSYKGEFRILSKDGTYRWLHAQVAARVQADGTFAGHISSCLDITEAKNALEDQRRLAKITDERNALVSLNKTKDEFISLASHQLRTPATTVKQYLGILIDEIPGELNEDQLQYAQIANNANDRGIIIIEDLLKTAQIDAKGYDVTLAPVNIIDLIQELITQYTPLLDTRNQKLVYKHTKDSVIIDADAAELSISLANLIENASKYSEHGKTITISVQQENKFVKVAVKDDGVGILKKDYSKIFDKFTRVNNTLSDTVTGNGLGLYWVKRIVELHKGRIEISSTPGKGTTISILLPI